MSQYAIAIKPHNGVESSESLGYQQPNPYPNGHLPDAEAGRAALRRLADRAIPSRLDRILNGMSDSEVIADVEISFGHLGDAKRTSEVRNDLGRLRR